MLQSTHLTSANFSLVETGMDSGVFVGDFQIPADYCKRSGYSAGANAGRHPGQMKFTF
jgi:hypothetical protein